LHRCRRPTGRRFCPSFGFCGVLFDVEGGNDWACLKRFRHLLRPPVPIVVLSGYPTPERQHRNLAPDLGCAGIVVKPATADLVIRALRRAAAGSPSSEYAVPRRPATLG
jgi:DNA-binding NarL/FixJ family response regulator